jgi:hypothetical protein
VKLSLRRRPRAAATVPLPPVAAAPPTIPQRIAQLVTDARVRSLLKSPPVAVATAAAGLVAGLLLGLALGALLVIASRED